MSQTIAITASRPDYVKPFNGVANVEAARQKRPANFTIRNVSDAFAIVELYDEIGGWGIWASELLPHLREIDGAGRTIEVRINSGGGDVFEGLTIANALKFMDARIVVVIYGLAASIASVIAVAGDEVRMPSNAMMMIHRPHMILWGEAEDLRKGAALLDTIEQQLINTYADRASQTPREQIAEMVAAETWMTAADAIALGFADTLIQDIRMAASASTSIEAKAAPAEAAALLAGPDTTEPIEETTVSDEPTASVEAETDATETVIEPVAETSATEAIEQDPAPAADVTDETPAASIEASVPVPGANLRISVRAVVENGQVVGLEFGDAVSTEAAADEVPADAPTADAEDGYPSQDAPEAEAVELNEEAIAIRAACAVLDASDKADGFIAAGMKFEEVRKALWDHRVAAAAQNDIVTQGSSLLAENPAAAPQAQQSDGPSALKLARQARKGRTK